MSVLIQGWNRIRSMFRRDALDRDFDEEAAAHIALAADDYVRRGISPAEAERQARLAFGGVAALKDAHRDARGLLWLDTLLYDLRLSVRALRRDRAFTLTAMVLLTIALALNATVFTIMQAMLFRGLPLARNSNRLVYPAVRPPNSPWGARYADFQAWRSAARSFTDLAFIDAAPVTFHGGNGGLLDTGMQRVTVNTFSLLGVRPLIGRDFVDADEAAGASPVTILSYRFWTTRFDRRADVIGTVVQLNGVSTMVVGVMPEGFAFMYERNLWTPLPATAGSRQGSLIGMAVGRLRDDATIRAAQTEFDTINQRLQVDDPVTDRSVGPLAFNYSQAVVGPDAPLIYESLWAAAWLVWAIACANCANLSLVRTMGRWRDYATRVALGAGQARMIRQILMESLIVSALAGTLAWWITKWSVGTWAASTVSRYVVLDYRVDTGVLAYLVGVSLAAAMLCAIAPIIRILQLGVGGALKGDARGVTRSLRGKRLASGLVAVQMTLAIVLLSGAGILVRSLANIVRANTGVRDVEHILVATVQIPSDKYLTPASRLEYFERLDAKLRTVPAIEALSTSSVVPANGGGIRRPIEIEGRPNAPSDPAGGTGVQFLTVGSQYFRVIGVAAISGRAFTDRDQIAAMPVAIVNQRFAEMSWPNRQAVGQRLRVSALGQAGEWLTVIGVMPNIMQGDPVRQEFKPLVYVPFRQQPMTRSWSSAGCCFNGTNILVRTSVPPDRVAAAVRAEIRNLDADVSLEEFSTLTARLGFNRDLMDLQHAELNKHAGVAPILAIVALLLAAMGLYAVIAHSVSQRTREIGIRMAIGAAAADIRRLILREGLQPVALGLLIGFTLSLGVNRILQTQLVGVSPYDPMTLITAPAILILVAVAACHLPARRAMRVEPVVALRHE